jgi:hypothetical protein
MDWREEERRGQRLAVGQRSRDSSGPRGVALDRGNELEATLPQFKMFIGVTAEMVFKDKQLVLLPLLSLGKIHL